MKHDPELRAELNVRTVLWQETEDEEAVGRAAGVLVQSDGCSRLLVSINQSIYIVIGIDPKGVVYLTAGQYHHDHWPIGMELFGEDGRPTKELRFPRPEKCKEEDQEP